MIEIIYNSTLKWKPLLMFVFYTYVKNFQFMFSFPLSP